MPAPKGNVYWKLAQNFGNGVPKLYTPEKFWEGALQYFAEYPNEPLYDSKMTSKGEIVEVPKPRAMSIPSLCAFLGISSATFYNYKNDKAFVEVISRIQDIMYAQKFEGASAGVFESNIIARDLGLANKQEIESNTGISINVLNKDAKEEIEKLQEKLNSDS